MKDLGTPEIIYKRQIAIKEGGEWIPLNAKDWQVDRYYAQGLIGLDAVEAGKRYYRWHVSANAPLDARVTEMDREVYYRSVLGDHAIERPVAADYYFKTNHRLRGMARYEGIDYPFLMHLACILELPLHDSQLRRGKEPPVMVHGIARRVAKDRYRAADMLKQAFDALVTAQQEVFACERQRLAQLPTPPAPAAGDSRQGKTRQPQSAE